MRRCGRGVVVNDSDIVQAVPVIAGERVHEQAMAVALPEENY